jgi:hypothetical protein
MPCASLARDNANVCANLINIAQIFAQVDDRLAAVETKLERLAEPSAEKIGTGAVTNFSARAQQLIALLDQRIKAALECEQRALCEATGDVVRSVLSEFVDEFKHVRSELELKFKQLQTLLAERSPLDPLSQQPN